MKFGMRKLSIEICIVARVSFKRQLVHRADLKCQAVGGG